MTEYTTEDIDLERFVDLFDTAMNSDNPAVQKCLKNLMLVLTLVHAETQDVQYGPLRKLVDDVNDLKRRLAIMESSLTSSKNTPYAGGINNPIWTTTTGIGYVPPNSGPYSISTY